MSSPVILDAQGGGTLILLKAFGHSNMPRGTFALLLRCREFTWMALARLYLLLMEWKWTEGCTISGWRGVMWLRVTPSFAGVPLFTGDCCAGSDHHNLMRIH